MPCYQAAEAADEALRSGGQDLSKVEEMLSAMLGRQLLSVHADVTGALTS